MTPATQPVQELSHWKENQTSAKIALSNTINNTRAKKVSDWTEKRVSLPRRAKRTSESSSAYNITSQAQDEHRRQRTAGLFRGFTGNSSETTNDPLGFASPSLTSQLTALLPGDKHGDHSPRPHDFIPIPYPIIPNESIDDEADRFEQWCEDSERNYQRATRASLSTSSPFAKEDMPPSSGGAFAAAPSTPNDETPQHLRLAMPKCNLLPVFPSGPLNLNPDGTEIKYRKSHAGPHAAYWDRADGEEIERLFTTGTIRPILFKDIPADRIVTYVNPICVEKKNDDGSLKFRTRLTIGGDRIQYPYDTTAVTAELESLKILLNCMISEDANFSTIDLTDFYLGTDLPHPEYIRIPIRLIPKKVIEFYDLEKFITSNALLCSVHKTHYGLPQAGALSQQRLFRHLQRHGYNPLPSSHSVCLPQQ